MSLNTGEHLRISWINHGPRSPLAMAFSTSTKAANAAPATTDAAAAAPQPYVDGDSTHFGFTEVNVDEKESRVRQVFDNVADSYDLMNDVMSAGVHWLWKDYLLDTSQVADLATMARREDVEFRILDVAGGAGDGKTLLFATENEVLLCMYHVD